MIVKIQKPLMTNGGEPMALIYNQSRSIHIQIPFSRVQHLFDEDEIKIFAKARVFMKQLNILSKVEDRSW
jgi:hypothetical protein